jgi:hypothetical protein
MNPKANSRWYHAFFRGCLQYENWLGQVVKINNNDRTGCAIGDFVEIGRLQRGAQVYNQFSFAQDENYI